MSDFSIALARLQASYYNSQPLSGTNLGGLAADGHVANFPAALKDVAEIAGVMETWIATLGGDNLNDVAAFESRIGAIESSNSKQVIYVSPTGNDVNIGSAAAPLKTSQSVLQAMKFGHDVTVYVDDDFDVDYYLFMSSPPISIRFRQWTGKNTARVVNKDASNLTGYAGLWWRGACSFRFDIPVYLDSENSSHGILNCAVTTDSAGTYFGGGAFGQSANNTSILCFLASGGRHNATFGGSAIAAITGKVFAGIGAGINPNSSPYITANISQG